MVFLVCHQQATYDLYMRWSWNLWYDN